MPPDGYRTRPDGTVYPIHSRKGGGILLAAGTALVVAASGGGLGVTSLGGADSAAISAAERGVIRDVQRNLWKAKQSARKGDTKRAWRQTRLRQGARRIDRAVECWALSYGEVREFFLRTPCRTMRRAQFPISDPHGNTVSVLVSRVRIARYSDARSFRRLIDEHGTGDIRPLLPHVRFTGQHYHSRIRGKTVVVAETEAKATDSAPSGAVLDAVASAATALAPR